ncbi:acyltransferase family protein [Kitasatospora sp. NPDC059146]|uniref:acyltransferase family protein n=1 Tax=unclassified Kitasatospora TaxID=2633591 RepID=UPI00367ABC43
MPDQPLSSRLPSLTGLRFVLAIAVVWYHVTYVSGFFSGSLQKALGAGEPLATGAVSGFFVLSGFLLTWVHRPGERARAFWRRRWWKIIPNHLLGWGATAAFFALTSAPVPMTVPPSHGPGTAVANLLLIQDWVPDADLYTGFNTPAWSISCEAFFYALFPVLIVAARRIPVRQLQIVWPLLAAAILVMPLASTLVPGPVLFDWLPVNENSLWFIYVFPPVRLLEFLLGILTARMIQTGTWRNIGRLPIGTFLVAFFAALPFLPAQYALATATAPAMAAVIARIAQADLAGRAGRLPSPTLLALGEASYALYITHWPLMMTVRHLIGIRPGLPPWVGFAIALSLIAAAVTMSLAVYRYVERPLVRRFAS